MGIASRAARDFYFMALFTALWLGRLTQSALFAFEQGRRSSDQRRNVITFHQKEERGYKKQKFSARHRFRLHHHQVQLYNQYQQNHQRTKRTKQRLTTIRGFNLEMRNKRNADYHALAVQIEQQKLTSFQNRPNHPINPDWD